MATETPAPEARKRASGAFFYSQHLCKYWEFTHIQTIKRYSIVLLRYQPLLDTKRRVAKIFKLCVSHRRECQKTNAIIRSGRELTGCRGLGRRAPDYPFNERRICP